MKYNGIIQRKLALLDDQVQRLRVYTRGKTAEDMAADWVMRSACERALQVCAEIMIDIAERIIAQRGAGPVASAVLALEKLLTLGVIADVEPYRSIVRLRNLIVHEYEEIDPGLLHEMVSRRLDDILRFRDEIDRAG